MSNLACSWTHHATARLGERFGTSSDKIKVRIEELIAAESYSIVEDKQPRSDKLAIRLNVADKPLGLVIALDPRGAVVVVTVLPEWKNRVSKHKWRKMS